MCPTPNTSGCSATHAGNAGSGAAAAGNMQAMVLQARLPPGDVQAMVHQARLPPGDVQILVQQAWLPLWLTRAAPRARAPPGALCSPGRRRCLQAAVAG